MGEDNYKWVITHDNGMQTAISSKQMEMLEEQYNRGMGFVNLGDIVVNLNTVVSIVHLLVVELDNVDN